MYLILQSISSHINTLDYADKYEVLLSALTQTGAISNEVVQTIRDSYITNLRWHANNFNLITHWFDAWNPGENVDGSSASMVASIIVICSAVLTNFLM